MTDLIKLREHVTMAEMIYTFVTAKATEICDTLPENPCVGAGPAIACFPNVAYYVCRVVKIAAHQIVSVMWEAVNLAFDVMEALVKAETISESQAFYDYYYSRAVYFNEIGHAEWNAKALEAIRINMKDQHMQMKFQLQERHKDIANHVGQDVSIKNEATCF